MPKRKSENQIMQSRREKGNNQLLLFAVAASAAFCACAQKLNDPETGVLLTSQLASTVHAHVQIVTILIACPWSLGTTV